MARAYPRSRGELVADVACAHSSNVAHLRECFAQVRALQRRAAASISSSHHRCLDRAVRTAGGPGVSVTHTNTESEDRQMMQTATVDIRRLQILNDSINRTIDALNQVRLSVYGAVTPNTFGVNPAIGGLAHAAAQNPFVASQLANQWAANPFTSAFGSTVTNPFTNPFANPYA